MASQISQAVSENITRLLADPAFQKAMTFLEADEDNKIQELKEMVAISGASFHEHETRSPMYKTRLEAAGAKDCQIDEVGNVFGYVYGVADSATRPQILIDAHMDTVFPLSTPLEVKEKDGRLYCPGITDDTAGLAADLSIVRAITHAGLRPLGTLMFSGSVGEEGEGNARGIRHLMRTHNTIDAVLCMEAYNECAVLRSAIGIKRYEFIFRGPGGHSWSDFGAPSALGAMGRAMAAIAELRVPEDPRTTFSLGTAHGGQSINSISAEARLKVDLRSVSLEELNRLDAHVLNLAREAMEAENARWHRSAENASRITMETVVVGQKPAGEEPLDSVLMQVACLATERVGAVPDLGGPTSTNQNIPVSMGVPSVVIGEGGDPQNLHSLNESYAPTESWKGPQKALIMLFALAGLDGVNQPLARVVLDRGPVL